MAQFSLENVPSTVAWIHALNAEQAREQCLAFNIQPDIRLQANRERLREFVDARNRARASENSIREKVLSADLLSGPASPTPQVAEVMSPGGPVSQQVESPQTLGRLGSTVVSDQLLRELHSMTMQAVTSTAQAVASEIRSFNIQSGEASVPPFVRDMLRELPRVDGSSISRTVEFLQGVGKVVALGISKDKSVLLSASSQTGGRFREFWIEAVARDYTWAQVLDHFRNTFLTPETLRSAQNSFLYRQQEPEENLSDFVKDMKSLFGILSPASTSDEIFQTVFRNIHATTRNTFAGLRPVQTLDDLISIAPFSTSVRGLAGNSVDAVQRQSGTDVRSVPCVDAGASWRLWPSVGHGGGRSFGPGRFSGDQRAGPGFRNREGYPGGDRAPWHGRGRLDQDFRSVRAPAPGAGPNSNRRVWQQRSGASGPRPGDVTGYTPGYMDNFQQRRGFSRHLN